MTAGPKNPAAFLGSAAIIIASGPSLSRADVDVCRGKAPTIAVNDNYQLAPWADVLYACDFAWWRLHIERVRAAGFSGELWTQDINAAGSYGLRRIESKSELGLSHKQGLIHQGGNSGFQALNLAYLWGAKRILLLGFDCNANGEQDHWFGKHPAPLVQAHASTYEMWRRHFVRAAVELKAAGVEVINCSMVSALNCWPKMPIERALCALPA